MKKTILLYCDSPLISTGFGTVAKYISEALDKDYDLTVCAINQYDDIQYTGNYKIYVSDNNPFNISKMKFLLEEKDWDIIILFNDWNIISQFNPDIEKARKRNKDLKVIAYTPIDTEYIPSEALVPLLDYDIIVTYTNWGKDIIENAQPTLKDKVKVIGHGTDLSVFKPLSETRIRKDRKTILSLGDNDFMVLNVARNQWRKDLPRSIQVVKLFRESPIFRKGTKLMYFINSKVSDMGGNLLDISYALEATDLVKFPDPNYFMETVGVTPEFLNQLYNMADVVISTSMGEGWGLPITEAMATKTPVLAPDNSSLREIIGQDEMRGYLMESGKTISEHFVYGIESSLLHPLANIESGVNKLGQIYKDKYKLTYGGETKEKINKAYDYSTFFSWEFIKTKWINLLKEIEYETK